MLLFCYKCETKLEESEELIEVVFGTPGGCVKHYNGVLHTCGNCGLAICTTNDEDAYPIGKIIKPEDEDQQ